MQSLIVENSKPGVTAIVNAGQVARAVERQPTSTFFVAGYSPWGPVATPRTVTSWPDYVRTFGGFDANSFLDDALYHFFNHAPGAQAVVSRVVGGDAVVATLTLQDTEDVDTLRVDAKHPSSRVDILVTVAAGTNADTFKLTVRSILLKYRKVIDNLKIDAASIDYINQNQALVTIVNLNSVTAAPGNIPGVLVETALAGGDDDFAGLSSASFIGIDDGESRTGLQVFNDESFGTGQVAVPGITSDTVHAALIAADEDYHRVGLLDPPLASVKDDLIAIRANYGTWYAELCWPWVEFLDFEGTGLKKFIPPSAIVAAECVRADRTIGVHHPPANLVAIPAALDVERSVNGAPQTDDNTRDVLNSHDVNVITPLPEAGVRLYGDRVLTADRRLQTIHAVRVMNLIYYSLKKGFGWAVFSPIDAQGRLFRDLRDTANGFLSSLFNSGALWSPDGTKAKAFLVVCDSSNNTADELENGIVHIQVGVHIVSAAERIVINIDNVPLFQDLSVLQK
jgi:phage tail sheath protein FI